MTIPIETQVRHRSTPPLLATGRVQSRREVADRLGGYRWRGSRLPCAPPPAVTASCRTSTCASLEPSLLRLPDRDMGRVRRGRWWATCMWYACGVATLVGGEVVIHTRIGGEGEDVDFLVEDGRVRDRDLWVHFADPPRAAWDRVHHFCATVLPF